MIYLLYHIFIKLSSIFLNFFLSFQTLELTAVGFLFSDLARISTVEELSSRPLSRFLYLMYLLYHKFFCLSRGFFIFFTVGFLFPFPLYIYNFIIIFLIMQYTNCTNFGIKICVKLTKKSLDKRCGTVV